MKTNPSEEVHRRAIAASLHVRATLRCLNNWMEAFRVCVSVRLDVLLPTSGVGLLETLRNRLLFCHRTFR